MYCVFDLFRTTSSDRCIFKPNQVIAFRYFDPSNKLGICAMCCKFWNGKYYTTFRRNVRGDVKGFNTPTHSML